MTSSFDRQGQKTKNRKQSLYTSNLQRCSAAMSSLSSLLESDVKARSSRTSHFPPFRRMRPRACSAASAARRRRRVADPLQSAMARGELCHVDFEVDAGRPHEWRRLYRATLWGNQSLSHHEALRAPTTGDTVSRRKRRKRTELGGTPALVLVPSLLRRGRELLSAETDSAPKMSVSARALGARWRELSDGQRRLYEDKRARDRTRWLTEKGWWLIPRPRLRRLK